MKEKVYFTDNFRQGTYGMLPGGGIGIRKNGQTSTTTDESGNDRREDCKPGHCFGSRCFKAQRAENWRNKWEGTVQWIAQSPYRIYHKRKKLVCRVHSFVLWESGGYRKEISAMKPYGLPVRAGGVSTSRSAVLPFHMPRPG